jgi:high-affinity iron transporter
VVRNCFGFNDQPKLGVFIWFAYGVLPEASQLLFEAIAAFVAVAVLSFMIYWMAVKGRNIRKEMEKRIESVTSRGTITGLVSLGFIVVFREGFETVLFLTPFLLGDAIATLIGMFVGILTAILLVYVVFVIGMKINFQRFFYFTSIMLILLAGGLSGYGVHELFEYYEKVGFEVGWLAKPAYNLNIPTSSPFHHKGIIGSIFAVMFGYSVSAEWARVIVHLSYLAVALPVVIWIYRQTNRKK